MFGTLVGLTAIVAGGKTFSDSEECGGFLLSEVFSRSLCVCVCVCVLEGRKAPFKTQRASVPQEVVSGQVCLGGQWGVVNVCLLGQTVNVILRVREGGGHTEQEESRHGKAHHRLVQILHG